MTIEFIGTTVPIVPDIAGKAAARLQKTLISRAFTVERDDHLGYNDD
jgi:hypothetical protein